MKVRTELRAGRDTATAVAIKAIAVNISDIDQRNRSSITGINSVTQTNAAVVCQYATATNSGKVSAAAAA
jgi:hypothetical protein